MFNNAENVNNITEAKKQFLSISDYKDAKEIVCRASVFDINKSFSILSLMSPS